MFKYELVTERGYVQVSLDVANADDFGLISYSGDGESVKRVKGWLEYQTGCRGHLIGDRTTAADLQAVMSRDVRFKPRRVAGEAVFYGMFPSGLLS